MSNSSFKLNIVTPTKIMEKNITYIRLKDETGFFGILKGHTNFLTVTVPSLCYYTDVNGKEVFLCWRSDEDDILYYHEVDTGFAGRKLIPPEELTD